MLKLAVIFESSPFDRKGLFNAVHERVRHLLKTGECTIDAYCIHSWDTAFSRRIRHNPEVPHEESVTIDDIAYRILWYDFSIIDHVTTEILHRRPLLFNRFMDRNVGLLKGYDAVLAHSFTGGLFAMEALRRFGVPYFVTWHGSDIHTHPWRNPLVLNYTRRIMEAASYNFFVSEALMNASDRLCVNVPKSVLYNGVAPGFYPFKSREERKKVVAFVGSLVAVKNVGALQPIFHEVRRMYEGPLEFWVVGDGKLRHKVEPALMADDSIKVVMWGNLPASDMPAMMNDIDVLVLPSHNEGLPLVCAEAIRCGACAIGADVGGVAEVIGKDYVVPHGDGFVASMASKVVSVLENGCVQTVPAHLDWTVTAEREMSFIKGLSS